ncbi:hypothetical protein XFF6990_90202 [Xanthomonas citri pv. fuscans]|uniref:Transposase n=1 Tax=Xanthomonas campestris pv. phaseoli TaxID=317013 RepID=A0A7Z7IYX7_XANCH|nr:hypothetical protein XFF6990_90202 [Xanthomonas citri pv. fuscans]SOO23216.1 hypothetical protein XFF6991_180327 [Xanthomonas phaseoli pv. phaseoli]
MPQGGHHPGKVLRVAQEVAGLGIADVRRLRQLEEENRKLKQWVVYLSLDNVMLWDVLPKKLERPRSARRAGAPTILRSASSITSFSKQLGQRRLQPPVLGLQVLQPPGLGHSLKPCTAFPICRHATSDAALTHCRCCWSS